MLNINLGKNKELMNKCRKLHEYAQLIARVRENLTSGMLIEQAIDEAVEFCIHHNVLRKILLDHREEVMDMLLTEYDEELHIRSEREIAKAEGETRINQLNQLLIEQNRMEDLIKAAKDPLFQEKLFTELGL